MRSDPLVTVLVPYRDAAETIEEALAGPLAEREVPLELVAVDDGSRDGGPDRVARLAAADGRIVRVATAGVGIARALAAGLAVARGRFVARMDADDVWLPGRLALQLDRLRADRSLAAIGTRVRAFPEAAVGGGLARYVAWQNAILTPDEHAREIFVESPLCHPSVTLRREALDRAGGFRDTSWAEDWDLWLRLAALGLGLAKVPDVKHLWRHRPGRATFTDPRYAFDRLREARAHYLAAWLRGRGRAVAVWGAGPTGKRLARALEGEGIAASMFVDIDPRKIGRTRRGAPVVAPHALRPGEHVVVVAVGAAGAREVLRPQLTGAGFVEGADFVFAA